MAIGRTFKESLQKCLRSLATRQSRSARHARPQPADQRANHRSGKKPQRAGVKNAQQRTLIRIRRQDDRAKKSDGKADPADDHRPRHREQNPLPADGVLAAQGEPPADKRRRAHAQGHAGDQQIRLRRAEDKIGQPLAYQQAGGQAQENGDDESGDSQARE